MKKHLTLAALLLFLAACGGDHVRPPNTENDPSKKPDPGQTEQKVSADKVRDAILAAWGKDTLCGAEIKLGEKLWQKMSVQLPGGSFKDVEHSVYLVTNIENHLDRNNVSVVVSRNKQNEAIETEQFEYTFQSPKIFSETPQPPPLSLHHFLSYSKACFENPSENWYPICSNLKVSEAVEKAPFKVGKDPKCRGLKNCQMNVKNIAFTLESGPANARQKQKIALKISRDLPYLSRFVSICSSSVKSTACYQLVDFDRGSR